MFENAVTQTYNQQDATLEILVMLAGMLLLGTLLGWLIRGFNNKVSLESAGDLANNTAQRANLSESTPTIGNSASKPRAVTKPSPVIDTKSYSTPRIDDLTKISGINSDVQHSLKSNGINSFIDLRDSNKESLRLTSLTNIDPREVETWPHQASLAAKGEWKKLSEYQDFTKRAREAHTPEAKQDAQDTDDLKKIEGIGPRIEEILNKNEIYTFAELSKTDRDTLKKYLISEDTRFEANETESWPHQAGMADKGQWEELKIYQEFIDEDDDDNQLSRPASLTTKRVENSSFTNNVSNINQTDDLKKIEGIGPRIEQLLQTNNISSFEALKNCSNEKLVSILENAGPQYRMHDPKTWPEQAKMAFSGEWDKLTAYQDILLGSRG